jgi:hypothetical protein
MLHSFIIDCSDDLTSITLDALTEAVKSSVMVILFLDDETHESSWVIHEINTAKENGIPIVTVIDQDRYPQVRKPLPYYIMVYAAVILFLCIHRGPSYLNIRSLAMISSSLSRW